MKYCKFRLLFIFFFQKKHILLKHLENKGMSSRVLSFVLHFPARGLAAIVESSLLFLLTVGGLLLVGTAIALWFSNTNPSWERLTPSAWVPQGKTGPPVSSLSEMEGLREKNYAKPYRSAQISIWVIAK